MHPSISSHSSHSIPILLVHFPCYLSSPFLFPVFPNMLFLSQHLKNSRLQYRNCALRHQLTLRAQKISFLEIFRTIETACDSLNNTNVSIGAAVLMRALFFDSFFTFDFTFDFICTCFAFRCQDPNSSHRMSQ